MKFFINTDKSILVNKPAPEQLKNPEKRQNKPVCTGVTSDYPEKNIKR